MGRAVHEAVERLPVIVIEIGGAGQVGVLAGEDGRWGRSARQRPCRSPDRPSVIWPEPEVGGPRCGRPLSACGDKISIPPAATIPLDTATGIHRRYGSARWSAASIPGPELALGDFLCARWPTTGRFPVRLVACGGVRVRLPRTVRVASRVACNCRPRLHRGRVRDTRAAARPAIEAGVSVRARCRCCLQCPEQHAWCGGAALTKEFMMFRLAVGDHPHRDCVTRTLGESIRSNS